MPPQLFADAHDSEHNARGFFKIGPQMVNPCDLLVKLMAETHCRESAPNPREVRRARHVYQGRTAMQKMQRMIRAIQRVA